MTVVSGSASSPSVAPTAARNKRKKIDIPYERWPNRLRRAVKSFIKITLLISLAVTIYMLATIDDVSLNIFFTILGQLIQLALYVVTILFSIILQFGLIFWFLSRPDAEIIRPGDDTTVTFDDYWGQPQLVKLVKQWMSLLRDRKEFEKMGGRYISGLLLYGPPGTGKTMLAKAIAGESGMAFISAQGTSFQGMFWGMDILRVLRFCKWARDLAKKYGACVAYIDEIDAVGMNRGGVRGSGPMVGSFTGFGLGMFALSTLLSQMDGMNKPTRKEKFLRRVYRFFGKEYKPKRDWHVIWMGSTNRPDVLDPALTRSGRLDTKIAVDPPDRASRRQIIEGYLRKIAHDETVDVEAIVADTAGMTPADIAGAITKDAVRIAFFEGRRKVSQKDIDRALMEQTLGMEAPIEEMDEHQRRVLAYHEAGHAVAQYYVMPDQKIVRVTIVRLTTGSLGHVMPVDTVDQHVEPVMRYAYEIIVALAGRAAEKILTGEIYNSVGGDYMTVQRNLWLMARTGFFGPALAMKATNETLLGEDERLARYWLQMEEITEQLLRRHWREVTALAEELLAKSTLNGKEVVEIIEANQSPEALREEQIIPRTLAAMRAQALAEVRRGTSSLQPTALGAPSTANGHAPEEEEVVIINGTSNGMHSGSQAAASNTQPTE
ncbi:MAG: AAA family ATPase [Thermoflexales bacterium]|nr:AAA family ATPase [Thermoflexales bacterium]MDW8053888.1 AAA family ATPase [Anaerolineae bacterium]MDW8292429.1 AAA family ATPase [Anaerolineae bacterium]